MAQFKQQLSAFLRVRYYNPKNLIFLLSPMNESNFLDGKKYKDVNRLRNGYVSQVLTNVNIVEIVKMGGKICITNERNIYTENFKISPYKKLRIIYLT